MSLVTLAVDRTPSQNLRQARSVQIQLNYRRERKGKTDTSNAESKCLQDDTGKSMLAHEKRMLPDSPAQPYNIKVPARWPLPTFPALIAYEARNGRWHAIPSSLLLVLPG